MVPIISATTVETNPPVIPLFTDCSALVMTLRILLVEPQPAAHDENVLFLRDVLAEIESGGYWSNWVHVEAIEAANMSEATAILASELVDVILLDLVLTNTQGVQTFRSLEAAAPQVPILLLVDAAETELAARMVREGAQDFLVKQQLDCAPLAHAIRNAIERHRLLAAARSASITDSLTGLYNRPGFLALADRDRKLAERLGRRLMVLIAEPCPNGTVEVTGIDAQQRRDLLLIEVADHLRSLANPTDMLARIGQTRFAMTIFDTDSESVEEAWARMHSAAASRRIRIGAAVFDSERSLPIDILLDQAARDLAPAALAIGR